MRDRVGYDGDLYEGYRTVNKHGCVSIDNKLYRLKNNSLNGQKVYLMRNPNSHTRTEYDMYLGDNFLYTLTEYTYKCT